MSWEQYQLVEYCKFADICYNVQLKDKQRIHDTIEASIKTDLKRDVDKQMESAFYNLEYSMKVSMKTYESVVRDLNEKKHFKYKRLIYKMVHDVKRLNYIGSKYLLLDWITEIITNTVGSLKGKKIGDLFSGTGIVSYHFRTLGCTTISNDAELYSYYITKAFSVCNYTSKCENIIKSLNDDKGTRVGFITRNYSPHEECKRMFFTVENAMRIDYIREKIEELNLDDNDYSFILASLIMSADSVSNVPAVYGCYLKNFKDKAKKEIIINPVHEMLFPGKNKSKVYNNDILELVKDMKKVDIVYLDPPYNQRQYSKNYFPLNIIAKTPEEQEKEIINGVTGIPESCFTSTFCKKGVEKSFEALFSNIKSEYIFMSYNSESLISKDDVIKLMGKYGEVKWYEQDYKRFKSFKYNKDTEIQEYLFCLKKSTTGPYTCE